MNARDAAEQALAQAGEPLGYRDLTERILAAGQWETNGATPEATINAQLSMDILTHGIESRFQRTAKGVFALRRWGLPEYIAASHRNGHNGHEEATADDGEENMALAARPAPTRPTPAMPAEAATVPEVEPLSFTDAAEQVLDLYGNQQPMHYRAITHQALELGLLETAGKTPEATLYASVLQEIARQEKRGETPRFVKVGRGLLSIGRWQHQGLADQIERHNAEVRAQLLTRLKGMPPDAFEALIGQLLAALGFDEVEVTRRSGDGGIDVRGTLVVGDVIRIRMAVQVKRWQHNVQSPTVQQVRGALGAHDQGLVITTSDYGPGAHREASRPDAVKVALMNGEQLVALLVEHGIGVQRAAYDLIELGPTGDDAE